MAKVKEYLVLRNIHPKVRRRLEKEAEYRGITPASYVKTILWEMFGVDEKDSEPQKKTE